MEVAHVTCWHCGASTPVQIARAPQFGFEVLGMAHVAGMLGYHDVRHQRVLVFCNEEHARAEVTKRGTFRLRPRGPQPKEPTP